MATAKRIKATVQRELELLAEARDELRVQLHLAKSDAKKEWATLETTWKRVQGELKRLGTDSKEPVKELDAAAHALVKELKAGYARIKKELKK